MPTDPSIRPDAGLPCRLCALLGLVVSILLTAGPARAAGVVGTGTPASCTEAALNAALVGGGSVTFNCGPNPVTIPVTQQKAIAVSTTIDGGSADRVILDAGGTTRHFLTRATLNRPTVSFTVRNLTLQHGRCPSTEPDLTDGPMVAGYGGAIRVGLYSPLTVSDSRFLNNTCPFPGNDFGAGALFAQRGTILVERSYFSGNTASNGGAIAVNHAAVTINDSTFTNNTTLPHADTFGGVGGAFYVDEANGGLIVIRRSTFSNNSAAFFAGAVHLYLANADQGAVIEDSTFQGNSTISIPNTIETSGALYHQNKPLTISGCTFTGNTTYGLGAGIYVVDSPALTVVNSTFSGNSAAGGANGTGGAIFLYQYAGTMSGTLSHLTIADNHADWTGGGIATSGAVNVSLRGSIVANNTTSQTTPIGANCATQLPDGGFNIQFPGPVLPGSPWDPTCTAGVAIVNPQLAPLADNGGPTQTRALLAGSPARNAVSSGCPPPAVDQRGASRPQLGTCDMGAYEAQQLTLSLSDASATEGNAGTTSAVFTVTLSSAPVQTVTVSYATADGTAAAGSDYVATSGSLTFAPGTTSRTISVPVLGDRVYEPNETFFVNLSGSVNASIADGQGQGTIQNDDPQPSLSIDDAAVVEGNSGTTPAAFTVSLSNASSQTITVSYATANGTAHAPGDYQSASGTLTFAPGVVSRPLSVLVVGDALVELDEKFVVNLSGAANASIGRGQGEATIVDDDAPSLSTRELSHGSREMQDLRAQAGPVADVDYYRIAQRARSSYEVVVDAASGDVQPLVLERLGADNATVLLPLSQAVGTGPSRSLRWQNPLSLTVVNQHIRVKSGGCTTTCGAKDVYRIRAYETTYTVPRFNNSGTQQTVLILQNPTNYAITGTVYFWSGAGTLLGSSAFSLAVKATLVLSTGSVSGVAGQSGAITVASDGRYGDLVGKTVALEPATGFSFDSPMVPRED